jgi:hypothetical protein
MVFGRAGAGFWSSGCGSRAARLPELRIAHLWGYLACMPVERSLRVNAIKHLAGAHAWKIKCQVHTAARAALSATVKALMSQHVFVFGTLKEGFPNFGANKGIRIPGKFVTHSGCGALLGPGMPNSRRR